MLVRRLARPLLGSMYILGGLDEVRNPHEKRPAAAGMVQFLRERTSGALPDDTTTVIRIDGALKVLAGVGLSLGKAPRLSAAVLSASLVPTTLAAHSFWKIDDEAERAEQRLAFFKNASMLGGLLLAVVDTEGKPSVAWRTRRAAKRLSRNVSHVAESTTESAERVARRTREALPL